MAERALRGTRLGATSYENDRNTDLAPRQEIAFDCPKGHHFSVPFAAEAPRSHWDMLRERRSIADLEQVLAERLALIRGDRGADGDGKNSQRKSA